ncbi:hypothetical protein BS860_24555 [Salmonella enterica]|nr:hypothetical protein [Salmonella enterica]
MTLIGQICPPIDFLDDYFSLTVRFRSIGLQTPKAGQAIGGFVGKELYGSIRDGYTTAPGITQGVGSYNPNYNPGLISSGFGPSASSSAGSGS